MHWKTDVIAMRIKWDGYWYLSLEKLTIFCDYIFHSLYMFFFSLLEIFILREQKLYPILDWILSKKNITVHHDEKHKMKCVFICYICYAKLILEMWSCKCDVYIRCIIVFSILYRCILYLSRETWIQRETDRDFRVGYMQIIKYFVETSNLFEGHINKPKKNSIIIIKTFRNIWRFFTTYRCNVRSCTLPRQIIIN